MKKLLIWGYATAILFSVGTVTAQDQDAAGQKAAKTEKKDWEKYKKEVLGWSDAQIEEYKRNKLGKDEKNAYKPGSKNKKQGERVSTDGRKPGTDVKKTEVKRD